jgi:hypothetical protein
MRDERQIIINPERADKAEDSLGKVFGVVFWLVAVVAALDYGLTGLWKWLQST